MKVGVVGMGLIGGSMAKAIHKKTEHTVIGWFAVLLFHLPVRQTPDYSALLLSDLVRFQTVPESHLVTHH